MESSTSKPTSFLVHCENNWLENFPSDFKPHYYQRYVNNILAVFTSSKNLEAFQNFLNGWHANISFTFENENQTVFSWCTYYLWR